MSQAQTYWLELSVKAEPEAVEPITELFARYGYNQGVVIEEAVKPGPDGGVEVDMTAPVTVRTYLPVTPEAEAAESERDPDVPGREERLQKLREGLWHLGRLLHIEDLQVAEKREEDWANAWKEFYQVHRLGRRTVIKPPWQEFQAGPEDVVVEIDPGMAFGTGLHPTTRLCLLLLEDLIPTLPAPPNVLDLGTGSGILAIAAAKLGASQVIAVDTDPVAVQSAKENIERNQLNGKILAVAGSLAVEEGGEKLGGFYSFPEESQRTPAELSENSPFDLIVANIIARVLSALAGAMAGALVPGGHLVASGIIAEKAAEVEQAFQAAGLTITGRQQEGDWIALQARKQ